MSQPPPVAIVLTPVASAAALAGLCAMSGIDVHVVPSASGAIAVIELDEKQPAAAAKPTPTGDAGPPATLTGDADTPAAEDTEAGSPGPTGGAGAPGESADDHLDVGDWDISELLGSVGDDVPPQADQLAKSLSRLSKTGVVLITASLSENGFEHGLSGQLTARHYNGGEAGDNVAVGLILGGADDVVEDLLLRRVRVADVPGHERSGDLPRWKAARMFGKGLRRRRP